MGMFLGIDAAASGLTAERLRMDVISNNIANANTTRTLEGGAYQRRYVVFRPRAAKTGQPFEKFLMGAVSRDEIRELGKNEDGFSSFLVRAAKNREPGEGVRAVRIETDTTPNPLVYDPGNPDANADGYVERPNVNIVSEMVDMITAHRAYQANTTTINTAKSMAMKALEIGNNS